MKKNKSISYFRKRKQIVFSETPRTVFSRKKLGHVANVIKGITRPHGKPTTVKSKVVKRLKKVRNIAPILLPTRKWGLTKVGNKMVKVSKAKQISYRNLTDAQLTDLVKQAINQKNWLVVSSATKQLEKNQRGITKWTLETFK